MSGNTNIDGAVPVQSWYDEIKNYGPHFGKEPQMGSFGKFGHFTQVVWKSSTELGLGVAIQNNKIYVVGNYKRAGNLLGSFAQNVPNINC